MSKFCANCGAEVSDGYAFCEKCGTPVNNAAPQPAPAGQPAYNQPYGPAPVQEPGNGMATAGFVSFLCCSALSPVGLILSIVGMTKAKSVGGKGKGLAIAGIILGALGILWFIISLIIAILNPELMSEFNY